MEGMDGQYTARVLTAPIAEDGYVQSFAPNDAEGMKAFLEKYGFVAVHGVLTDEACDATVDEFWAKNEKNGLDRGDPATWETFWNNQYFRHFAIMGMRADFSKAQLENRQSTTAYDVCTALYGTASLIVDHDRLGIMRPTADRPEWKTIENWLHLDCNPTEGNPSIAGFRDDCTRVDFAETMIGQSLFALTDQKVEDGGFHCVPGSHRFSMEWAAEHGDCGSDRNMNVPIESCLHKCIQQIPLRKGTLLFWTSLLFHGNHPNRSDRFRAVQYVRYMPTGLRYSPLVTDAEWFPEGFEVTPHGRAVFGFNDGTRDDATRGDV